MNRTVSFTVAGATLAWISASLCAVAVSLSAGSMGNAWAAEAPSLNAADLGQGRYSTTSMLLEKFFFNILTVDMHFGKPAQTKFTELAQGKSYSKQIEQQLAQAAIESDRVVVQLRFKRDVPLDRWMGVVRDNIEQAREAGLITAALEKKVGGTLPIMFAALKERGFKEGDKVFYDVRPGSLRTTVVGFDGPTLVDNTNKEADIPRVVLASYFAPGSEFRTPLIKALMK